MRVVSWNAQMRGMETDERDRDRCDKPRDNKTRSQFKLDLSLIDDATTRPVSSVAFCSMDALFTPAHTAPSEDAIPRLKTPTQ